MHGLIIKSTGSWYQLITKSGERFNCRLKGKFRLQEITTTNPLAVGDHVAFALEPNQETGVITHLYERKNYIIRQSVKQSKQRQIIAANLDQAFLIVTLTSPRTSLGFIDRFLVTAAAYGILGGIILNKVDLLNTQDIERFQAIYQPLGYPYYPISVLKNTHVEPLLDALKNKISLLGGHSGVGKTSLINAVLPEANLRTRELSSWHDKGMHTTTFAEMYALPSGGFLVDTPGIRELGVLDVKPQELGLFFPEIKERMDSCKFYNCTHTHEPGCEVLAAVNCGEIQASRYESYSNIFYNCDTRA